MRRGVTRSGASGRYPEEPLEEDIDQNRAHEYSVSIRSYSIAYKEPRLILRPAEQSQPLDLADQEERAGDEDGDMFAL